MNDEIFVFGSNLGGYHGAGAALYALEHHGAVYGVGKGHTGQSYALPTKDEQVKTLKLDRIQDYVHEFMEFATLNPQLRFKVTRMGCGLAGYTDEQVGPMFIGAPANCFFPPEWERFGYQCWQNERLE